MEKYIAVALGGAVGALCRMALGEWVMTKVSSFPYGTVVVNLIGCLIIGLVLGLYMQKPDLPQWARFFLVVGGLGAFTTFSTFAFEMLQLMMAESYVQALFYGFVQVVGGLILCWFGILLARMLWAI
jgi:protein CrcB